MRIRLPFGRIRRQTPRFPIARRLLPVACLLFLLPPLLLILIAAFTSLPPVLLDTHQYDGSVRVLDRHGKVLVEVRSDDGSRARWVPLSQISPAMQQAMIAAEDQRFRYHPGIDPLAIGRASGQNLWNRRIVSGASTLTQQLARTVRPRSRTMTGKIGEMALALRIEASLSKREILEQYLNLVFFGPSLRGVESASRFWFDKPASALSLAESATLAAIPRGPTAYNPLKSPNAVTQRRDLILDRMAASGVASREDVERAKREPLAAQAHATGWGAPHFTRGLLSGAIHPEVGPLADRASEVHSTLDATLQREVQTAARTQLASLRHRNATAAAVVVIENQTGEILAWLGAPDFLDEAHGGQNDGVLALRQPGSSLKPFVYAAAMQDLGWTAATVLPDIELHVTTEQGDYTPRNYDGQYHGPVRLREALANSYNIPAVHAASLIGPARVLELLRRVGLGSLDRDASHYGAAIALGDGEVRLLDLANAYACLARGGVVQPVRTMRSAKDRTGAQILLPSAPADRAIPEGFAAVLLDVLHDPHARAAAFGARSVLDLPFEVAVKTGTSKGFRDNLTVGATREVTVAVWVGNFDGSPMQDVSGITGAGPLFHAVMLAAMKDRTPEPFGFDGLDVERVPVCALSGMRANSHCPHRITETFLSGTAPEGTCEVHVEIALDRRNGLRAGEDCPAAHVEKRVFETWAPPFSRWATAARRPLPPAWSPLCPGTDRPSGSLSLRYPFPGAVFVTDPSMHDQAQAIMLRAEAPAGLGSVRFRVDGQVFVKSGPPYEHAVRLAPGHHKVRVEADGYPPSEEVEFSVR